MLFIIVIFNIIEKISNTKIKYAILSKNTTKFNKKSKKYFHYPKDHKNFNNSRETERNPQAKGKQRKAFN